MRRLAQSRSHVIKSFDLFNNVQFFIVFRAPGKITKKIHVAAFDLQKFLMASCLRKLLNFFQNRQNEMWQICCYCIKIRFWDWIFWILDSIKHRAKWTVLVELHSIFFYNFWPTSFSEVALSPKCLIKTIGPGFSMFVRNFAPAQIFLWIFRQLREKLNF